jgi:hypothetical protein
MNLELAAPDAAIQRGHAVRVAGILFLAGGLLATVTILLPPPAEGSEAAIAAVGGLSAGIGALLLMLKPRLGPRALLALMLAGTSRCVRRWR